MFAVLITVDIYIDIFSNHVNFSQTYKLSCWGEDEMSVQLAQPLYIRLYIY